MSNYIITRFALIVLFLFTAYPARAFNVYLSQDLGVDGLLRYCKYNNGKTYTFNSTDLCPLTLQTDPPGFGQGLGFLKGEYQDGLTKVCIYDVLGQRQGLRLQSTAICPLSSNF